MFSRKINKKIAESKRLEEEREGKYQEKAPGYQRHQQPVRSYEEEQDETGESFPSSTYASLPKQKSKSRIAAGFNNISSTLPPSVSTNNDTFSYSNNQRYGNSGSSNMINSRSSSSFRNNQLPPTRNNLPNDIINEEEDEETEEEEVEEEERILQRSTDEIQERFDGDTIEPTYPTQDYSRSENLLDEYNEDLQIASLSASSIRRSRSASSQQQQQQQQNQRQQQLQRSNVVDRESYNIPGSNSRLNEYEEAQQQPQISSPPMISRTSSRLGSRTNSQSLQQQQQQDRRASRRSSITTERDRRQMSVERQPSLSIPLSSMENNELILDQPGSGSISNSIVNMSNLQSQRQEQQLYGNLSNFNMNYMGNNRLNSNNPSLMDQEMRNIAASNAASRDVIPLPIEIPNSVTDTDAFRRYLSVRRGASPFLYNDQNHDDDDDDGERSTLESLGRNRPGTSSQIGSPEILASTTASSRIPPPFSAQSSVHLQPSPPSESGRRSNPDSSTGPLPPPCSGGQPDHASQFLKKTTSLSHAIMTLALLSASAAQLRFVVAYSHAHSYPTLNYFLICSCIIIEVLVGIGFVVLARFDFQEVFVEKMHSYLIFGLFIVTVANVIVAAFALDDHICGEILKQQAVPPPLTIEQQQQLQQQQLQLDQNQF